MKRKIKIRFQNGLEFQSSVQDILSELKDDFEFINSNDPDFIVFGPYGNNVPEKGDYVRIGYYCEAIAPDLSICDWAFGIPTEREIDHPRYKRIQWHGLNPSKLIKNINVEQEYQLKTKFCNFIYSNPITYRERFFKKLSGYKHIDSPGRSMNNMPPVEEQFEGSKWEIKRQFVHPYKFTIAFESYSYPGYQTEKLYDAMQMNSIPIYCGDPLIGDIFNTDSFINASEFIEPTARSLIPFIQHYSQYSFKDYRPATYDSLYFRIRRKLKTIGKNLKMHVQTHDLKPLIDRIIHLDNDPEQYKAMLAQPWFKNNQIPSGLSLKSRWLDIFNSKDA